MSENTPPSAFNPMPPVIVALFAVIAGLELVFSLGTLGLFGGADASSWRFLAIERYGVNTSLFSWMLENKHYPIEHLLRFISFSFLHQSMISTAVSCALLLAIGKMVGSAFSGPAVLAFFVGSAAVGAVCYCLAAPEGAWLFGSFTGIYGLIGAYTFMMWVTLKVHNAPPGQAFSLIALLMAVQLVFEILFGGTKTWIADIIAFFTGFVLACFFVPGGIGRVLELMRRK